MKRPRTKKYSEEDVDNAVNAVYEKEVSISKAAKEFNIPRMTLSDRVSNRHPGEVGNPTVFTKEEEKK